MTKGRLTICLLKNPRLEPRSKIGPYAESVENKRNGTLFNPCLSSVRRGGWNVELVFKLAVYKPRLFGSTFFGPPRRIKRWKSLEKERHKSIPWKRIKVGALWENPAGGVRWKNCL